jgi:hypothetical protein
MKVVHSFNELYAGSAVQPIRNTNDYSGVPKQKPQATETPAATDESAAG